ncbi:MAG: MBL fold metallo-hydrolase [Desulfosalsimonadaceae bacterium]
MSECTNNRFQALENINAEIDVLIDEQNYDKVCKKIHLTSEAEAVWNDCFSDSRCTSIKMGDQCWEKALNPELWPVNKIGRYQLNPPSSATRSSKKIEDPIFQKNWVVLFWAKRLRAEIQRKNTDCYLRRLDDLVNYLERNLPPEPSNLAMTEEVPEKLKIYFYFLMELSAASLDYEQIGYAKRANRLLQRLPRSLRTHDKHRCFFILSECWIKYINGLAYRHLGQYHKASLEFNDIILKYKQIIGDRGKLYFTIQKTLELNLLYFPSIINLAIIYLQMQLTYSCLQTLACLDKSIGVSPFKKRDKDLYSIQAFRMLELREDSSRKLESVLKKLVFFNKPSISKNKVELPIKSDSFQKEEGLLTRFVELAMNELMEIAKGVGYSCHANENKFKDWVEGKSDQKTGVSELIIIEGVERVSFAYSALNSLWTWVKDNRMDRTGHDRQMAELLSWTGLIIDKKNSVSANNVKKAIEELIQLANENAKQLFNRIDINTDQGGGGKSPSCPRCSTRIILSYLREEDYEAFTKDIVKFLSKARECWLKDKTKYRDMFIKAIEERDNAKGESVHIHRLNLRNNLQLYQPIEDCDWCMDNNYKDAFDKSFKELMPCRLNEGIEADMDDLKENDRLGSDDYDQIMKAHEEHFNLHLKKSTKHAPEEQAIHFLGLQRWNSISPAEGRSLGGGYLLYRTDKGGTVDLCVAIDPGFDFIRNLFHCGFSLTDIDIILLSHSHLDHIRDFESIVHLLEKLKSRRINVVLSLGTYNRLKHIFENQQFRRYVEPLIIDIEKDINRDNFFEGLGDTKSDSYCFSFIGKEGHYVDDLLWSFEEPGKQSLKNNGNIPLKIWPTRAYHDDHSKISDSFGFIIHFPMGIGDECLKFGYTGDTKWVTEKFYKEISGNHGYHPTGIIDQYNNCDVLLVHLGSLINHRDDQSFSSKDKKSKLKEKCQKNIRKENHPYLPGLIGLLNEFVTRIGPTDQHLVLLSEFGEELRGTIRTDLVKRLKEVFKLDILPVDVGLDVLCATKKIADPKDRYKFWCVQCRQFHSVKKVDYQHFGMDEALFYFCRTCKKTTSPDRLQDRLRHVYEVGRTLRISDRKND